MNQQSFTPRNTRNIMKDDLLHEQNNFYDNEVDQFGELIKQERSQLYQQRRYMRAGEDPHDEDMMNKQRMEELITNPKGYFWDRFVCSGVGRGPDVQSQSLLFPFIVYIIIAAIFIGITFALRGKDDILRIFLIAFAAVIVILTVLDFLPTSVDSDGSVIRGRRQG